MQNDILADLVQGLVQVQAKAGASVSLLCGCVCVMAWDGWLAGKSMDSSFKMLSMVSPDM